MLHALAFSTIHTSGVDDSIYILIFKSFLQRYLVYIIAFKSMFKTF